MLLTELIFQENFPGIEDLQLKMLKRKRRSQEELSKKEAEGLQHQNSEAIENGKENGESRVREENKIYRVSYLKTEV